LPYFTAVSGRLEVSDVPQTRHPLRREEQLSFLAVSYQFLANGGFHCERSGGGEEP
jgi:hypothetical protein